MSVGFKSGGSYGDFDTHFITERELVDRYGTGKIWSWGALPGDGSTTESGLANGLNYLNRTKRIKQIQVEYNMGFAITETGELWSWGSAAANGYGALGNNTITAQYSPAQVYGGGNNWSYVQFHWAGGNTDYIAVCALKTDGTAWVWGYNGVYTDSNGGLGTNTPIGVHYSTPVQFMPGRTFKSISTGGESIAAITSNGELWTAGYNNWGQLGWGPGLSSSSTSSPVQIGSDTNWKVVNKGFSNTCAIKTDGTLWGWGMGGNTGDGTSASRSSPVQEYTHSNNWVSVHGGTYGVFGIKTDGTLWGWASANYAGQLGYNDTVGCTYPQKVFGTQNWKSVSRSQSTFPHVTGLTKDGQIWTWGYWGHTGDLGDSTTVSRSTPTQVLPGTFWLKQGNDAALY